MTEERKWRGENGAEVPPEEQLRLNQRTEASGIRLDNFDEVFDRMRNDPSFILRFEVMFAMSTIEAATPTRRLERERVAWDAMRIAAEAIVHIKRAIPGLPSTPDINRGRDVWASLLMFVEWCDSATAIVRPAARSLSINDRRLIRLTLDRLRQEVQRPETPALARDPEVREESTPSIASQAPGKQAMDWSSLPPFNQCSGDWIRSSRAAQVEHIKTATLANYRLEGTKNEDQSYGRDSQGRIWAKPGRNAHVWYLRSTLRYRTQDNQPSRKSSEKPS